MPATAAGLGVTNVLDPVQSIDGGAKYLKQQLDAFGGDVVKALAAYNAGPGAVQRFGGDPALRRDPELRPHRAGQRRGLPAGTTTSAPSLSGTAVPPRSETNDHRSHSRADAFDRAR